MIHGNGNAVFIGYIPIIQQGLRPLSWPCMSPKSFYCIDSVWYFGVHEGRFACKLRGGDVVTFADDLARFHRLASFVLWQSISMIRGMHSLLFANTSFYSEQPWNTFRKFDVWISRDILWIFRSRSVLLYVGIFFFWDRGGWGIFNWFYNKKNSLNSENNFLSNRVKNYQ